MLQSSCVNVFFVVIRESGKNANQCAQERQPLSKGAAVSYESCEEPLLLWK